MLTCTIKFSLNSHLAYAILQMAPKDNVRIQKFFSLASYFFQRHVLPVPFLSHNSLCVGKVKAIPTRPSVKYLTGPSIGEKLGKEAESTLEKISINLSGEVLHTKYAIYWKLLTVSMLLQPRGSIFQNVFWAGLNSNLVKI